jgi:hypothetical protein
MRWLQRSIVVLGALALVAAGAGSAGGERASRRAAESHAARTMMLIVPRPAGERIPRGARVLEVTVKRPHRPPTSDVSVTGAAKVRRIASLINGLETLQPGAFDCTGKADDPVVTFTFRAAPGGRVLARASQIVAPGRPGGSCEPMTLTVRGHTQIPLLGGTSVVRAAELLLGVRVPA